MSRLGQRGDPPTRLLVVGDPRLGAEVAADLQTRFGPSAHFSKPAGAATQIDETTLGLVVVVDAATPEGIALAEASLSSLANMARAQSLHRVALVPAERPATLAQRLYEASATEVLEWPGEEETLPKLLRELLVTPLGAPPPARDRALRRVVHAHLTLLRCTGESFCTAVKAGIVLLVGVTSSTDRKQRIAVRLQKIPGVRHVLSQRLFVKDNK